METRPSHTKGRLFAGSSSPWLVLALLGLCAGIYWGFASFLLQKHSSEFLMAYAVAGVGTVLAVYLLRFWAEGGPIPKSHIDDPRLIACLRGGVEEVIRISTVSLVEKGYLKLDWNVVAVNPEKDQREPTDAVEGRILGLTVTSQPAVSLLSDSRLNDLCADFEEALKKAGLVPNQAQVRGRMIRAVTGLVLILGVGVSKIWIALSEGRSNIWFTVALMTLFSGLVLYSLRSRRTRRGNNFLSGVQRLYQGALFQSDRLRAEGRIEELVLLTSVFGIGALGAGRYAPDWFDVAKSPGLFSQMDPNSVNFSVGLQQYHLSSTSTPTITNDSGYSSCGGGSDWSGGGSYSPDYSSGIDMTTSGGGCGGGSSCGSSSGSGCGG